MNEDRAERRLFNRERVILSARCRKVDGRSETLIISDLSANGCRVYSDEMILRVGQRLTLQPAKFEGISGQVRWVDGKRAGIAFDRPLHDAIAEHLQRQYAVPSNPTRTAVRVISASLPRF